MVLCEDDEPEREAIVSRVKRSAAAVGGVMVVGGLLAGGFVLYSAISRPSVPETSSPPPGFTLVCSRVTPACVSSAAGRVRHPVAWIQSGTKLITDGLQVKGVLASEGFTVHDGAGSVDSEPLTPASYPNLPSKLRSPGTYSINVVTIGGTSLQYLRTSAGRVYFAKLTWSHAGHVFSLGLTSSEQMPSLALLRQIWETVLYG
jgi:hypothetical protein